MKQIKQRRLLVLMLVVSQLGCMAFGLVWAAQWLGRTFDEFIHRNVAAQGNSLAYDLARRVSERRILNIEPGTEGWDRLQQLCERTKTPHEGFVTVLRADTGALVCHSDLESNPSLLQEFPGRLQLVGKDGVRPLVEAVKQADKARNALAQGHLEIDGKLYETTSISLPKLNAILAIHQSEESIDHSVEELVQPLVQVALVLTIAVVGASGMLTAFLVSRFESTLTAVNASLEKEVDRRTHSLVRTRNAVVFGLAKLAESREKDAGRHLERIRSYVTILASEMAKHHSEINHTFVANLAVASSLHDVGKVGVPDAVLLKPDRLTPVERRAMQLHTVIGGECLAAIGRQLGDDDFLELGRQVAVAHHEQWDGTGYPQGLQGKEIPMAARIVALADVYDALTTSRPYREAMSHGDARDWIVSQYGTQFDPDVVEAFVAREQDFVKVRRTDDVAHPSAHGSSAEPSPTERASAILAADNVNLLAETFAAHRN